MIESERPSVQIRIWLLGPFLLERRTGAGMWEPIAKKVWNKRGYAYPLLQRLLCTYSRRAERITLIDDFWPNPDKPELLDRYINDAAYYLRKVLAIPDAVKTFGNASGYQLADQSMIWIDVDACGELLKEAERLGCTSSAALLLLEQASRYLQRGAFLEQQMGQWAYARRGSVERMNYRCHLWLAEAYEQHDLPGQAETLYNRLLEDDPTDEDILRHLMRLYHQQGMKQLARKCYEDTRQRLHHLKQSFSPDLQAFAQHLLSEPSTVVLQAFSYTPTFSTYQPQTGSLSLSSQAQDIMGEEQEEQDMDRLRRQISQQVFNLVGATFIGPQAMPLMIDNIAERLSQTLNKPSTIDSKTLFYLERRVGNYWRDRNDMVLPAQDLLPYIMEDLQKFITLLDRSMLPNARTHLCSITGTAAMLVGELYFDMGNYIRAQNFQDIAITAAHEANNAVLEAVAWARKSFACTYNGNRSEALTCLQIARHLAQNANSTVRAWLAAVEAEIQANLGDRKACSEALREASLVEDQKFLAEDCYWIHFDSSLAAGYQGISFLKLSSLGQRDLLLNAQTALYEALNLLHPSMKRRQPTILIDLAGTYVQQRNIEQACTHALQAMHLATQIKSQVTIQRFLSLRNDLKSWEETQCIKDLDQSIGSLLLNSERH